MSSEVATVRFARARAAKIREGIHHYLDTLATIAEAWHENDWRSLGYDSWAAYVDGEFAAERLRLPAEHRRKAVEELRLAGMSQRAIASATGVSEGTVRNDLTASGAQNYAPERITGTDGKAYQSTRQQPAPEPEPEVTPAPPKPPAPRVKAEPSAVDQMLADDPDVQAAEFLRRFAGALVRAGVVYEFPADRVGALADERLIESLEHHAALVVKYAGEVRKHRPTRLRLVKEA